MTHPPLTLSTRDVALELYGLLREIDPARWRDDLARAARARLAQIEERLAGLLEATWPSHLELRVRLEEMYRLVRDRAPGEIPDEEELRRQWMRFREELQRAYEALAASLREWDVHVPSLRPTNYGRNVFHVLTALGVILLVQYVLVTPALLIGVAAAAAAFVWTMETGRRYSRRWNALMVTLFGPLAHPHEEHRVASSTWFATALLILALTGSPLVGVTAVAILGVADPAAAIVGRRWGRHKLVNGRTLEGSLTFVVTGFLAALAVLLAWYGPTLAEAVAIAAAAAVLGALAELGTRRIDDNIAIPLGAGLGAWVTAGVML